MLFSPFPTLRPPLPLFQFTLVDLSGFRPPSHPPPALVSLYESIYLTHPSRDNAKEVIKHYITSFMSASDDNVMKVVKDFFLRKMMIFSSFLEDDEIDHNHINQVVELHPWLSNTLLGPQQWLSYEVEIHHRRRSFLAGINPLHGRSSGIVG